MSFAAPEPTCGFSRIAYPPIASRIHTPYQLQLSTSRCATSPVDSNFTYLLFKPKISSAHHGLPAGGKLSGLGNSTRHPAKVQTSREKGANTQRTGLQQTDDLDRPSSERVTAEKKLFRNTTDTDAPRSFVMYKSRRRRRWRIWSKSKRQNKYRNNKSKNKTMTMTMSRGRRRRDKRKRASMKGRRRSRNRWMKRLKLIFGREKHDVLNELSQGDHNTSFSYSVNMEVNTNCFEANDYGKIYKYIRSRDELCPDPSNVTCTKFLGDSQLICLLGYAY
ncbi:unnamed protein product, partial [Nesidiocoris tenuis]